MIASLAFAILFVLPLTQFSQAETNSPQGSKTTASAHLVPRCGGELNMCGYVDSNTQHLVIPRRFQIALPFREGLAAVRIAGKYGYIDASGQELIKPQFDAAGKFYQGLAEVVVGAKAGLIGQDGILQVHPQFARAIPFDLNVILVREGKWHPEGRELLPGLDNHFGFAHRRYGLYHVKTGWIIKPSLQLQVFTKDATGLVWAKQKDRNAHFGLIRSDGSWQVEPRFTHVQCLSEGIAVVATGDSQWGAVDAEGKVIVPLIYDWASYWDHGYGLAKKDGKHGLLDSTGKLIGGRFFDKVERATDKQLARVFLDGAWVSVTDEGGLIPDQRELEIILLCPGGLTLKRESNRLAVYNMDGKRINKTLFDMRSYSTNDCSAPLSVTSKGKWSFITLDGKQLHDPLKFDNVLKFSKGKAWVKMNGLWGLIDDTGAFMIKPQYEVIHHIKETYRVKKNGEEIFLDAAGKRIAQPPKYEFDPSVLLKCPGNIRIVTENGKWGMVDKNGKVMIPLQHRALSCFRQGIAWAPDPQKKAWCPIGADGHFQDNPACKTTYYPFRLSHSSPEQLSDDPFESSVLWIVAYLEYASGKRDEMPKMIHERDWRKRTTRAQ